MTGPSSFGIDTIWEAHNNFLLLHRLKLVQDEDREGGPDVGESSECTGLLQRRVSLNTHLNLQCPQYRKNLMEGVGAYRLEPQFLHRKEKGEKCDYRAKKETIRQTNRQTGEQTDNQTDKQTVCLYTIVLPNSSAASPSSLSSTIAAPAL